MKTEETTLAAKEVCPCRTSLHNHSVANETTTKHTTKATTETMSSSDIICNA